MTDFEYIFQQVRKLHYTKLQWVELQQRRELYERK